MTEEHTQVEAEPIAEPIAEVEAQPAPEPTPEAEAQPAKEWTDSDEDEARAFGWKAADEWRGEKPPGYIEDPRKYTDRLENFKPFAKVKERMDKQEHEFKEQARKMAAMNEMALNAQRRQFQAEMDGLTQAQRAAVEEADTDKYDAIERQRAGLAKEFREATAPPEAPPQVDTYVRDYEARPEGEWLKNPILRQAAGAIIDSNQAILSQPAQVQVEYAEAEVRKLYPGYFPAPAAPQKQVQRVDGGGLAGGSRSNPYTSLPADAKEAFNRYVTEGLFENNETDKKAFADEYNAA